MAVRPSPLLAVLVFVLISMFAAEIGAASTDRLSATVLPATADSGSPRLAVYWEGGGEVFLTATLRQATGADLELVGGKAMDMGVTLVPVPAALADAGAAASLHLEVHDGDGKVVARHAQDIMSLRGTSEFVWHSVFHGPGPENTVFSAAVWDDGGGPALYVGGEFLTAGGRLVNRVARWDGNEWTPLTGQAGTGVEGNSASRVEALWVYDGALIVAGDFTSAGGLPISHIARWDGADWSAVGAGTSGRVSALAEYGGELIAGGQFVNAGGTGVNNIARWDGSAWSPLSGVSGTGVSGPVEALTVFDGELIAGGGMFFAGGVLVANVARWNGNDWLPLSGASGTGVVGQVTALTVHENQLVVGGSFTSAGGFPVKNVARWDGGEWSVMGAGLGEDFVGEVDSLTVFDGALIAGGLFETAGEAVVNHLARWDGGEWLPLPGVSGTGVGGLVSVGFDSSRVSALTEFDGDLIVTGRFATAGAEAANHVARFDGARWRSLAEAGASGLTADVLALEIYDGELIVGGDFLTAGGVVVNHIARWDGRDWSALTGPAGTGTNGPVTALAVHAGELYAGGSFTEAGGVVANGVARWDGATWSVLSGPYGPGVVQTTGTNPTGSVHALISHDDALYAGGDFVYAGGVETHGIARWDGAEWSALDGGVFHPGGYAVFALAEFAGDLIAGGFFTQAGGVTVNGVARWDGSAWSALAGSGGNGMNGTVLDLVVFDGDLIAGGAFSQAGGQPVGLIARWDGSNWSPLGAGIVGNDAGSVAVYGDDLIAAGFFFQAGGVPVENVARWDGSAWSALDSPGGTGLNSGVTALAHFPAGGPAWIDEKLLAGGNFMFSGGRVNWRLAAYGPRSDLAVSPGLIDFGAVAAGGSRGPLTVAVTNNGPDTVTVSDLTDPGGPFALAGGNCGALPFTLEPMATCSLDYSFSPADAGSASAPVTITSDAVGGPHGFTLKGIGTDQSLHLAPGALDFGEVAVGAAAGPLYATLTNAGESMTEISVVTVPTVPFTEVAGGCGAAPFSLAPFESCTLAYIFAPDTPGPVLSSVEVSADAPGDPLTLALAGTGLGRVLEVDTDLLHFGAVLLGSTGAVLSVTLENPGETFVNVNEVGVPAPPFFRAGGSCGPGPFSLPAGDSCTLDFGFSPVDTGDFETTVEIAGNAPGSPHAVSLMGIGMGPLIELAPSVVDFGALTAGESAEVTVTLTNTGNTGLNLDGVSAPPAPFALTGAGTCQPPQTLGPGGECTLVLRFEPAELGAYAGMIEVASDAISSPDAVTLAGIAFDATQTKLSGSEGEAFHNFGTSLAVSGDTLAVGAMGAGAVYVFIRDEQGWSEQVRLTPSVDSGFNGFGGAVSLSGDTLLIGASNLAVDGNTSQGGAFVFVRENGTWSEQAQLTAADGAAFDNLGVSVAQSGDTALVGAGNANVGGNTNQGAAYVFIRDGATWTEQAKLVAADGAAFENFGRAAALSGDTALVGAGNAGVNGNNGQGAVYVFTGAGATWTQQAKLTAAEGGPNHHFGASLATRDDTLLVGAPGYDPGGQFGRGAAYVFERQDGDWNQHLRLDASDGAGGDNFGNAVALLGDTALVGARQAAVGGNNGQGAAYVFSRDGGDWTQQEKLTAVDGAGNDNLGTAVALSERSALVSAPQARIDGNAQQGAVYEFMLAEDGAPLLDISPQALDFGEVVAGQTGQAELNIGNSGDADLVIEALLEPAAPFELAGGTCGPLPHTLPPTASCSVSVSFAPETPGLFDASLQIVSNVAGSPHTVALSGTGVQPPEPAPPMTRLTASDGAANDWFGRSVAIDGDTVIVSADAADIGGNSNQGAAYVFVYEDGEWSEQAKLTAGDGAQWNQFGFSVSLDGDTALIGSAAGAAYVFSRHDGVWTEQARLAASDGHANDGFGLAVSLDGDTALIGAREHDTDGSTNQGAAYVFVRSGNDWVEQAKLTAGDGVWFDLFGISVALSGDTALVGAAFHDTGGNDNQGAVYVFTREGGNWTEQTKLFDPAGMAADWFGNAVSLDGDTAIISADQRNASGPGKAYVYTRQGGVWEEQDVLAASDGVGGDIFGESVAVQGDHALVGALFADQARGAAYLYTREADAWSQQTRFWVEDAMPDDQLGKSVDIGGTWAAIGAWTESEGGNTGQGAVYIADLGIEPPPKPGVLEVEPAELMLVKVPVDDTRTGVVTVRNAGKPGVNEPLEIQSIGLEGDPAFAITGGSCETGLILDPAADCTVEITFGPVVPGTVVGTLEVRTVDEQLAVADLIGEGIEVPPVEDMIFGDRFQISDAP